MYRPRRFRRTAVLVAVLALTLTLAACSDDEDDATGTSLGSGTSASPAASAPKPGELVVYAAASLTGTFNELKAAFEDANPGSKLTFIFGGSSSLATQINGGAPVDVFAAASPATMKTVTDEGNGEGTPVIFVRNTLEIAVPADNPGDVDSLDDFANDDLDIALCATEVPCGAAADRVFAAAKIGPQPDTRESDVKAVLTKVELGEVDAALVYKTDVLAAGDKVQGIEFPEAEDVKNDYLIVALKESDHADLARAWIEFLQSEEAQQVLEEAGFESP